MSETPHKLYKVEVLTTVKDIYYVDAQYPEEAARNWFEGDLVNSECVEVDEASIQVIEVNDD